MASALLLIVVFLLDLIAFALAVAAEQHRSKAILHTDLSGSHCIYSSDIATGYGLGSLLFLLCSQLLVMLASRCLCCGARRRGLRPAASRACAVVLFITCWMTFFVAEACLLAGSATNAYHTKYRHYVTRTNLSCQTLRKGVLGAAAAFIVLCAIFTQLYYVSYSRTAAADYVFAPPSYSSDSGIRMVRFEYVVLPLYSHMPQAPYTPTDRKSVTRIADFGIPPLRGRLRSPLLSLCLMHLNLPTFSFVWPFFALVVGPLRLSFWACPSDVLHLSLDVPCNCSHNQPSSLATKHGNLSLYGPRAAKGGVGCFLGCLYHEHWRLVGPRCASKEVTNLLDLHVEEMELWCRQSMEIKK
ncbi:hypothetical protein V2J09_000798 [Rumex salicifolius]